MDDYITKNTDDDTR